MSSHAQSARGTNSACRSRMAARLRGARRSVSSLALATWEIAEQSPAVLNLAIGQPALSLLPMEAVQVHSRLTTHDSRLTTHDSPLTTHHSPLTTHHPQLTTTDPPLTHLSPTSHPPHPMEAVQVTCTAAGPCGRDASPSAWPCQHTLTHAVTLSQDGAARLSTYDARHILQYGAPAGSGHYLSALATFLTAQLQRPPMLTPSRTMYVPGPRYGTHGAYTRASLLTTVRIAYARQPRLCRIYRVPCTVAPQVPARPDDALRHDRQLRRAGARDPDAHHARGRGAHGGLGLGLGLD